MLSVNDKVYVWGEDDYFTRRWDGLVGDVVSISEECVVIKSVIDGEEYKVTDIEDIFHVGTGPAAKYQTYKVEDIFEDIEDDPDNVIMNIPPLISAQMGLDIGDTLVVESVGESLVLRKKTNEDVDDLYKPDNFEGC